MNKRLMKISAYSFSLLWF